MPSCVGTSDSFISSKRPKAFFPVVAKDSGVDRDLDGLVRGHTVRVGNSLQLITWTFDPVFIKKLMKSDYIDTRIAELTEHQIQAETQRYMVKVYGWMCLALFITGVVAMYAASNEALMRIILGSIPVFVGLFIVQIVAVGALAGLVNRMRATTAMMIFVGYSVLNGLTLSVIFLMYTTESIASTFYITGGTFGVMSLYGYTTKSDLSKWGNLLFMGLIGIVIASVANFFMQSTTLYWITTYVGVLVFVGLTAYDTQKIKNSNIIGNEGTEEDNKEAIMGALTLYLDFINLFLKLLRIFGRRK